MICRPLDGLKDIIALAGTGVNEDFPNVCMISSLFHLLDRLFLCIKHGLVSWQTTFLTKAYMLLKCHNNDGILYASYCDKYLTDRMHVFGCFSHQHIVSPITYFPSESNCEVSAMKKLLIALLLVSSVIALTVCALAAEEWSYRVDDEGFAHITEYRGTNNNPSIPEKLRDHYVMGIDQDAIPSSAQSVTVPVALIDFSDGCIASGVRIKAKHGAPVLDWAEAHGYHAVDLSDLDFSDVVVDLTGSDYYIMSSDRYSLSPALGRMLQPAQLLYVPEKNTAWQISTLTNSDGRSIATVVELDPMYTYDEIIIRVDHASRGGNGSIHWEDGVAVAEYTNTDRHIIDVLKNLFGLNGRIHVFNTDFEIRVNTAGFMGMLGIPFHSLREDAPVIDASQQFIESIRFETDFAVELEIGQAKERIWFDNGVHEIEIGSCPIPLGPTKFSLKLFAMLQLTNTDSSTKSIVFNNGHMGFSYNDATGTWTNLYRSPEAGYTQIIQNHGEEIAINFGISADFLECVTLLEVVTGPSWKREVVSSTVEEFEGTKNCIDVTNDAVWRTQVTLTPGLDVTAIPFLRNLKKDSKFKFVDYKYYWSNEWDLGFGVHAGVTAGMVTSVYITKEWENARFDTKFYCNGAELENGETGHFEVSRYGEYRRTDQCTRQRGLIMDPAISGVEPIIVDLSMYDTYYDCRGHDWNMVRPGYGFKGWIDEDGNRFPFDTYNQPIDWSGYKTLTADWEKDSDLPATTNWYIRPYNVWYLGLMEFDGQEVCRIHAYGNDPQQYYLSTIYDKLVEAGNTTEASAFKGIWTGNYASYPLYVAYGDQSGSHTTNLVFGDMVVGTSGYPNCYYLRTVTCNDNMIQCGSYHNCPNLVSVKLSESAQDVPRFTSDISLRNVVLPSSLKIVDEYMFSNCKSLTSLSLPEGIVSVGDSAFSDSGLTSLSWPSAVRTVPRYCFYGCSNLESVSIDVPLQQIGTYAFAKCSSLRNLDLTVSEIDEFAFVDTFGLDSLTIHSDTLTLNSGALYSGAKSVVIDAETINGDICLVGQYFTSVNINADTINGSIEIESPMLSEVIINCRKCNDITIKGAMDTVIINNSERMGALWLEDCPTLDAITVGDVESVNLIKCYRLKDIEIGAIEGLMNFERLYALESLEIADGTPEIGYHSFSYCYSLCDLSIPADTTIADEAFTYNETNPAIHRRIISSISIPVNTQLYTLHFESVHGKESDDWNLPAGQTFALFAPKGRDGMTFQGWYLETDKNALMPAGIEFTMPAKETTLYAQWSADYLTVDNGVLGSYYHPDGATVLEIPDGVTTLPSSCIDYGTTVVYIPSSVTSIDVSAFDYAYCLQSIFVDPENKHFYEFDNALYSTDGRLIAVPRARTDDTLILSDNCTAITSHSFRFTHNAGHPYTISTIFVSEALDTFESNWWQFIPSTCVFYGPEQGPASDEIRRQGFTYNEFPVLYYSGDDLIGFIMGQQGDEIPSLVPERPGMIFCGWSSKKDGDVLPEPITIPNGGTVLHAVWSDGQSPDTRVTLSLSALTVPIGQDLPFTVDAPGAEQIRVIAVTPDGYWDSELYFDGEHGEGTLWWWSNVDHTVYAQAMFGGVWSATGQSYIVETTSAGPLTAPEQHFPSIVWYGDDIEFSFGYSENVEWYKVSMEDEVEWILDHDYDEPGTYIIEGFYEGKALEAGTVYSAGVSVWSQGHEPGWGGEHRIAVVDRGKVLTLPSGLGVIGEEAFLGVHAQMIVVPAGVTSIGPRAFADCPNLVAVVLPDSVTSIDGTAFEGCTDRLVIVNG